MIDQRTAERFRALVDVRGPDECHPWQGTLNAKGYGHLSVGPRGAAVTLLAHRIAYELAHGPIPDGDQVCHSCDNPPCCNGAHLFAGTAAANQHDKGAKGRAARGMANRGGGKLTDDDVRAIRQRLAAGDTKTAIAASFGVTRTQVYLIATGKQWSHVT